MDDTGLTDVSGCADAHTACGPIWIGTARYVQITLTPSAHIATFIQQDIDRFIWKRNPHDMTSEEDGSQHDYRRWMKAKTAILNKKLGGLGIPDWDSQVGAIQAHYIVRYLGPSQALVQRSLRRHAKASKDFYSSL